jgi:heterodisulfide reductase subunit B
MNMDGLVTALGAETVDWNNKTLCCGGSLSVTQTEIALDLTRKIVSDARAAGADVVAVSCPMCQANLDARQHQLEREPGSNGAGEVPILYFTQLMALALGLGDKGAALGKNMVDARPLLRQKVVLS